MHQTDAPLPPTEKTSLSKRLISYPIRTVKQYLADIREGHPDQWADQVAIQVLASELGRSIAILNQDGTLHNLIGADFGGAAIVGEPLFTCFNDTRDHYDALILNPGHDAADVLRQLQERHRAARLEEEAERPVARAVPGSANG